MRNIIDKLIAWRYFIAIVVFVICLSFNLHGSSIANWANFGVRETVYGKSYHVPEIQLAEGEFNYLSALKQWGTSSQVADDIIIGVPRMIRTDEWLVQTPFYLSQVNQDFPLINRIYGFDGQNMVVAYNAPVRDISILGKPFNWGFLLLGAEKGLSWYWCFKVLTMLLLAYEFSMILTKKNTYLSVLGAFWITFTPSVQWWFMQHLGDVVYFSLAAMVAIYHYFHVKSWFQKIFLAVLLSLALTGFVLVIYPAFQVPFAYLILGTFIIYFGKYWKSGKCQVWDWLLMAISLMLLIGMSGWTLYQSRGALEATLNTVYPGSRISTGGDMGLERLGDFLLTFFLPFQIPSESNQVELSSSIHFLFPILICLPFVLNKQAIKEQVYPLFLLSWTICLGGYAFIGIPALLSKVTLFSFVTGPRAWQTFSVLAVFVSIWFVSYLGNKISKIYVWPMAIGSMTLLGIAYLTMTHDAWRLYAGRKLLLVFSLAIIFCFLLAFRRRKVGFILALSPLIFLSGMTVNPVVSGLSSLENKSLSRAIRELVVVNKDALWLSEGVLYNYPVMFGARVVNSVRFYPDHTLMTQLDSNNDFEQEWNRYAHMKFARTDNDLIMTNPAPDVLEVQLPKEDLKRLGVTYVLTQEANYRAYYEGTELVYGPDRDNHVILKVSQP